MILAVTQLAPIFPNELGKNWKIKEEHKKKLAWICWEAHHAGAKFPGPMQPFGRLCWFHDNSRPSLEPQASPGFFVGWHMEPGFQYRGVLLVANYQKMLQGITQLTQVEGIEGEIGDNPVEYRVPLCPGEERGFVNLFSRP